MKAAAILACSVFLMASNAIAPDGFDGTWTTETKDAKLPNRPDVFLLQNGLYTCKSCVPSFSIKADGIPHEVAGNPYFDAATLTVSDANTFRVDHVKAGKVTSESVLRVGPDGQTLTAEFAHSIGASAEVVKGHLTAQRVATGPNGSANLSGAWQITSLSEADIDRTFALNVSGDTLWMSRPAGQAYNARLSGEEAPYSGDPGITSVRVRRLAANQIEETDLRNTMVVGITTLTLSEDKKSLKTVHVDKLHGFENESVAVRQ